MGSFWLEMISIFQEKWLKYVKLPLRNWNMDTFMLPVAEVVEVVAVAEMEAIVSPIVKPMRLAVVAVTNNISGT